jgi:hypothetical protein
MEELQKRGLATPIRVGFGRDYAHQLLTDLIQASIEIGCRKHPNLRFVSWQEILTYQATPKGTKESKEPFRIPVRIKGTHTRLEPDGKPFAIWYEEGEWRFPVCLVVEADCGTEPLEPLNIFERANIEFKLLGYLDILRRKTYAAHFGFPNLLATFVTTSERRMKNIMALLDRLTEGQGSPHILFAAMPHLHQELVPMPTDAFFSQPYQRVGHPPFDLLQELKAGANTKAA